MSPFDLPPIAALLRLTHDLVLALSGAMAPSLGDGLATTAAVVLLTLAVRALLVPLGVAQVRADLDRRRLAPQVAELRRRHTDARELAETIAALHAREGVSPFAGCLPLLAQAPVVMVVYGVFAHASVAGAPNLLLAHALGDVGLGTSLAATVGAGALGLGPVTLYAALLAVIGVAGVVLARAAAPAVPPTGPARHVATLAPVLSITFAAFVPLAAVLYLATSAAWTCAERLVVRRVLVARRRSQPTG